MVRTTLALCAVVLSGCAAHTMVEGTARPADGGPDPCAVKVFVRTSPNAGQVRILVDNDPLYPRGACSGTLTWRLMTPGYTFDPGQGIVLGATPSPGNCTAAGSDQYSCTVNLPSTGTKFNYSITVLGPAGKKTVDPSIIVD
jgi:hypothetical protein